MKHFAIFLSLWLSGSITLQLAIGLNVGAVAFAASASCYYTAIFWLSIRMFDINFRGHVVAALIMSSGLLALLQSLGARSLQFSSRVAGKVAWIDGHMTIDGLINLLFGIGIFCAWIMVTLWILRRSTGPILGK